MRASAPCRGTRGTRSPERRRAPCCTPRRSRGARRAVAPGGVVVGDARVQHEVVAPARDRDRVELDRAEPPEDLEHRFGPPSTDRAGASRWRATRNRRAASAETFIGGTLPCVRRRLYSRERGTGRRRRRPRLARGGGARERRTTERHDLRDRHGGRSAARGDIHSARRRRLVLLGARQRRDGGRPRRERYSTDLAHGLRR